MTKTELPWRISNNLAAWYLVKASSELREGQVCEARIGEREVVLYRSRGKAHALDLYCAHMGAKLCHGELHNDCLTCPLHGWQYRADGHVLGGKQSIQSYPTTEVNGGIFVFNGLQALYDPPPPQPELHWSSAPPRLIEAPWFALTANAFDLSLIHI